MIDKIEECCDFSVAVLDGFYGWISEAIAILLFVVIFNVFIKWVLRRLQNHYEKQKKIWVYSFFKALYLPFSCYVWFFAIIETVGLIISQFSSPSIGLRHSAIAIGTISAVYWFLMRWKKLAVQHLASKSKNRQLTIERGKIDAIDKIVTVALTFFALLFLLEATGRSVNTLIAFGGIGGLALAFASQEIIANFFGGFMIYLTHPFSIGDNVLIPDRSIEGIVEEIGWYMTRVRSPDKKPIYIPNSTFTKLIVVTLSRMSHRQFKELIGLSYADMDKVAPITEAIQEMLQQHPDIDHNQNMIAQLTALGTHSIDIQVQAFTATTDYVGFQKIKQDLFLKIAQIVNKNGATFAVPCQEITLHRQQGKTRRQPQNIS